MITGEPPLSFYAVTQELNFERKAVRQLITDFFIHLQVF